LDQIDAVVAVVVGRVAQVPAGAIGDGGGRVAGDVRRGEQVRPAGQLLSEKIKKSRKSFVREGLRVLWTGFRGRFVF
jgi:hypothetical protein